MSFDHDYGEKGDTMRVNPNKDLTWDDVEGVSQVIVEIETEPTPYRGLMKRVREVQSAFKGDDGPSASRVLEAALYNMETESVVDTLATSDWEISDEWVDRIYD